MSQSSAQYYAFINEILENKTVWTMKDEQGFPSSTNLSGETAIPFWSLKSRAEKVISTNPAYSKFQPQEINLGDFLNKWLTGLEKDGLHVGINWSGKRATGYDVKPNKIAERIKYEKENG
ncbi:DUF2750 domain-containing protein [Paenibacillus sp. LMG 31456]|uniref:DUF2750 domain-containing protein n=1 Tax=Paenibacillus foliorum TaxID=2654974 RepID=A0A972H8C5_9BACL|nr:DUF2750 domain-containing protein [Paenibacillus foliorum]NOU98281.1 DUF2750 domain-containing protein [Paenibacillus foliorum]